MNTGSYTHADAGENQRFSSWKRARAERKPWSILEMGAVLGGFVVFWPLGLLALYVKHRKGEIWTGASAMQGPWTQWKTPRDAADHFAGACGAWKRSGWQGFAPTGNQAFDEYRKTKLEELEVMRRKLDEERAAFDDFVSKLRSAKDREDFERFMKDKDAPKTQE